MFCNKLVLLTASLSALTNFRSLVHIRENHIELIWRLQCMYSTAAIIHALWQWAPRNEKEFEVHTTWKQNSIELLTVSVGHLLDWNSTFSALAFRASWITWKLFFEKCNLFIRTLQRRFTNMPDIVNPLNAKLNPICHLLALLGAHHILQVSKVRVKSGTATVRRRD